MGDIMTDLPGCSLGKLREDGEFIGNLDMASVVKMSQAVSGEIVLNRLIERLMVIAVEHAGAARGLLLLPQGEEPRVVAEATTDRDAVEVRLCEARASSDLLPESILRRVIRSQESVILEDSLAANAYSADDYIKRERPRSVLCLPLVNRARLIGVLYLENLLSSLVFTPARITVLHLLASQAAISLENARLYANLQQAEEKTRKSEGELQRAIDSIPALAWSAAADGRVMTFNKQWHDYTGLSPEEGLPGGWAASFHPDDVGKVVAKWTEILGAGEAGEIEARMRRFDGEYRCFLLRAAPLRDEMGNILRWYGTNTDIEDLKEAEALLDGEKRLLEMIAKGDSLPVILDALCRVVEELAPGSISSILLLDPDMKRLRHAAAPSLPDSYTRAVDGGLVSPRAGSCGTAAYRGEKVFVSDIATDPLWADYRELALSHGLRACWSTPILSTEGAVLGTFAIYARQAREITYRESCITEQFTHIASIVVERKRAEDALRKSEAFLAEGQRISHTGSWNWNVATGKVVWSEESYRIFGFDPDSVDPTLQLFLDRVHPEDLSYIKETLESALKENTDFGFDYRILLPDGSIRHMQDVGRRVLGESGEINEYIGTTIDVTDRRRAAEELRRSEVSLGKVQSELAHVTRVTTLGELAASIAHEVNQPIAGVVINATTCLRWLGRVNEQSVNVTQARETLHRIIRDGTRAGEVIARIRSLFKKAEPAREPLDMNEAIREVVILTHSEIDRNRIILLLRLADDLPPVLGDRVQLQQVILDLILNAIEAVSPIEGGPRELIVTTQPGEGAEILVSVRDSGIGLGPESVERIFTAFHTTKPGGLGMGLSISRSIVESHGGRLWATGNDGPGATFQFTLSTQFQATPAPAHP